MQYNIDYDVAAMFICVFILVYLIVKRVSYSIQNRIAMCLVVSVWMAACFEILGGFNWEHTQLQIIHYGYYFVYGLTPFFLAVYSIYMSNRQELMWKRSNMILIYFPLVIEFLLLVSNSFTEWIFRLDFFDHIQREGGVYIWYLAAAYYFIYVIVLTHRNKEMIPKVKRIALVAYLIVLIPFVLINAAYDYMVIENFGIALCLLLMILTIQNPEEVRDKLTGLLNRDCFFSVMRNMFHKKKNFHIITISVSNFTQMMNLLGIDNINRIIQQVAIYLGRTSYHKKMIFYEGHGLFHVVLEEADPEQTLQIARNILWNLLNFWETQDFTMDIETNVFLSSCPKDIGSEEEIMQFSEEIRKRDYEINCVLFTSEVDWEKEKRKEVVLRAIKKGLREQKFQTYYQPIFSVKEQKCTSAEALVRLYDEKLGQASSEEFVTIAEQNGLILDIGLIVLRQVCKMLKTKEYRDSGLRFMNVNLSVIQCMKRSHMKKLLEILREYKIQPGQIQFEVTETAAVTSTDTMINNMQLLSEAGYPFAIDDFGTGYSNVGYLVNLKCDAIKLDKSIVWAAEENEDSKIILENTVLLAKKLNRSVIAEGIETVSQKQYLEQMGCDYLQGYLFSEAIPERDFLRFIRKEREERKSYEG